jgi:3-methyladenine DNA glycosylase/8-oxoguanine DNA glycosylase
MVHQVNVDGLLLKYLQEAKVGQYRRIERAFREACQLDLDKISIETLEAVHGIGPKTARMILLYYLPDSEVVPLDTHILKHLRALGHEGVPKATPPAGPTYQRWEAAFVGEAKKAGMSVRDFDTYVWKLYATSTKATRA